MSILRLVVLAAVAIILWAAFISVANSFTATNYVQFAASTVLILAVAIQRINGVQRWLASPKNRRKQLVEVVANQALLNLCYSKPITAELLELSVHVWEVPLWYRRLFPFAFRVRLKKTIRRKPLRFFAKWQWRPVLNRVVAVGLIKQVPSGVEFRKNVGLVGVCIANNDRSSVLKLRTGNATYRTALGASDENAWKQHGASVTHNLELKDAVVLSRSYGCATISVKSNGPQAIRLTTSPEPLRHLLNLANNAANSLA